MLGTLILGVVAGWAAEPAEPYVKRALEGALLSEAPIDAAELRLFSFAICLLVAALISALAGGGGPLALAVGAVLGVFAPRVVRRLQERGRPD